MAHDTHRHHESEERHEHGHEEPAAGHAEAAPAGAPATMAGNVAAQVGPRMLQKKVARRAATKAKAGHAGDGEKGAAHATGDEPRAEAASAPSGPSGIDLATLQAFIAKHEGYVNHVYLDSRGFPTAGIGHLLTGGGWHVGEPVSAEQITAWFHSDVATAIAGAKGVMGASFDRLDEARKMVIIDMVFNLGVGGFAGFHHTIAAIESGAYAQAASDMLQSAWASQVGSRATEDASIMRSGQLAGGGGGGGGGAQPPGGGTSTAPSLADVRDGRGVLKKGEKGPSVADIQRLLHITADGDFGNHTFAAVEAFQRSHHLSVDGIVGRATLHALESGHGEPAQAPGANTGGTPYPSGGAGIGPASGSSHGPHPKPKYVYPIDRSMRPERIDQGVDFGGAGHILAIGNGVVRRDSESGWPGLGGYLEYSLTDGNHAGQSIYVAEDIQVEVHSGEHVRAGQVIAHATGGSTGIETGFSNGGGSTLARSTGGYSEGELTAAGAAFSRFLQDLGGPGGLAEGRPTVGKVPKKYY